MIEESRFKSGNFASLATLFRVAFLCPKEGVRAAPSALEPARVLLYGENIGFNFGNTEVIEYKAGGFHGR